MRALPLLSAPVRAPARAADADFQLAAEIQTQEMDLRRHSGRADSRDSAHSTG